MACAATAHAVIQGDVEKMPKNRDVAFPGILVMVAAVYAVLVATGHVPGPIESIREIWTWITTLIT
jgi:hypothetical protein